MNRNLCYIQFGCRLFLAAILGLQAVQVFLPSLGESCIGMLPSVQGFPPLGTALAGLTLIVAVWLAFGVFTRQITVWALATQAAICLFQPGFDLDAASMGQFMVMVAAATPLFLFGTDRFAMQRHRQRAYV